MINSLPIGYKITIEENVFSIFHVNKLLVQLQNPTYRRPTYWTNENLTDEELDLVERILKLIYRIDFHA